MNKNRYKTIMAVSSTLNIVQAMALLNPNDYLAPEDVGTHGLVPERVDGYVAYQPEQVPIEKLNEFNMGNPREYISRFLDSTQYVTWIPFHATLESCVLEALTLLPQQFGTIFPMRIKSNQWLTMVMFDHLRGRLISGNWRWYELQDHKDVKDYLIIDDAAYSGTQLVGMVQSIGYSADNIVLAVPWMSQYAYQKLAADHRVKIVTRNIISPEENELAFLYGYSTEGRPRPRPVPLYFDHKLPDNVSTLTQVYGKGKTPGKRNYGELLAARPNKDPIFRLKDDLKSLGVAV
jgi:hypothetical protein